MSLAEPTKDEVLTAIRDLDADDEMTEVIVAALERMLPDEKPFIWIKVEGGIADYGGDYDVVDVEQVDFDTEGMDAEDIGRMIAAARRIPDRLASLPRDDPRWLDKEGIEQTFYDELIAMEWGICDECPEVYELASRTDHCSEEGLCWDHCTDRDEHENEAHRRDQEEADRLAEEERQQRLANARAVLAAEGELPDGR